MKILFQLSGSIACFKACQVISQLVQGGHEVQTAATRSALRFVGAATLEGLTGRPVFMDAFENGRAMDHIALTRWADGAILCPATAGRLNRMAMGLGDDVLGALFLAYPLREKPYWVVPAMNHQMWAHPATEASLKKLESWGIQVWGPASGAQACGETGLGRMIESEEILRRLNESLDHIRRNTRADRLGSFHHEREHGENGSLYRGLADGEGRDRHRSLRGERIDSVSGEAQP